jgi:hypothetical protein
LGAFFLEVWDASAVVTASEVEGSPASMAAAAENGGERREEGFSFA